MGPTFRQDMPPSGGYGPIEYARTIKKARFSGYAIFGAVIGITAAAWCRYYYHKHYSKLERLMENDAKVAMEPFVIAERERMFLHRLRENRDMENELMKDVPGWETGTWMGEKLYHNLAGRFPHVWGEEYYIHTKPYDLWDRNQEKRNK